MYKAINPKNVFLKIDAWFCCKCHCYNPVIKIDMEIPPDYIPKTINRECHECKNVTRIGTTGKEIV